MANDPNAPPGALATDAVVKFTGNAVAAGAGSTDAGSTISLVHVSGTGDAILWPSGKVINFMEDKDRLDRLEFQGDTAPPRTANSSPREPADVKSSEPEITQARSKVEQASVRTSEEATVCIFQPAGSGFGTSGVYLDGDYIGTLHGGRYFCFALAPGQHSFVGATGRGKFWKGSLIATLAAGRLYYLESSTASKRFKPIPNRQAFKEQTADSKDLGSSAKVRWVSLPLPAARVNRQAASPAPVTSPPSPAATQGSSGAQQRSAVGGGPARDATNGRAPDGKQRVSVTFLGDSATKQADTVLITAVSWMFKGSEGGAFLPDASLTVIQEPSGFSSSASGPVVLSMSAPYTNADHPSRLYFKMEGDLQIWWSNTPAKGTPLPLSPPWLAASKELPASPDHPAGGLLVSSHAANGAPLVLFIEFSGTSIARLGTE